MTQLPNVGPPKSRALVKAGADLRCDDLLVLTDGTEGEEHVTWGRASRVVRYRPVWRWLLAES